MAIPNGSGSEVLRNAAIDTNNAAAANIDFGGTTGTGSVRSSGNTSGVISVPTNVIITVLTVTCFANAANGNVSIIVDWQGSGADIYIAKALNLAANEVFVMNDKFVLRQGDRLKVYNSANSCDWSVHFIYQDWT